MISIMITNANFDKELSNSTKKFIKVTCYITSLCFLFYAIVFNSGIATILFVLAGLPLSSMAYSIKITKTNFNNSIILNGYSKKRKASAGIFSPLTLYFIGLVLVLASFIGSFDDLRGPLMMSGIATVLFNLARNRRN